jgi:NADPH-dependent curcumin reductase CurA
LISRQIVTQIAISHPNCKVIGIAGSAGKCKNLKDLGCHAVINYKDEDWRKQFKTTVGFFDIYFDNGMWRE